jgi:hypothetical protein
VDETARLERLSRGPLSTCSVKVLVLVFVCGCLVSKQCCSHAARGSCTKERRLDLSFGTGMEAVSSLTMWNIVWSCDSGLVLQSIKSCGESLCLTVTTMNLCG